MLIVRRFSVFVKNNAFDLLCKQTIDQYMMNVHKKKQDCILFLSALVFILHGHLRISLAVIALQSDFSIDQRQQIACPVQTQQDGQQNFLPVERQSIANERN